MTQSIMSSSAAAAWREPIPFGQNPLLLRQPTTICFERPQDLDPIGVLHFSSCRRTRVKQTCSGMIFLDRTKCDPVCQYNVRALPAARQTPSGQPDANPTRLREDAE
jgi:hypothetical protein